MTFASSLDPIIAGLALAISSGGLQVPNGLAFYPAKGRDAVKIAAEVGSIEYKRVGGGFGVRLKPGLTYQKAVQIILKDTAGIKPLSLSAPSTGKASEDEETDYLENYNRMVDERAYPYPEMDPEQLATARKQRDRMPVFVPKGPLPRRLSGLWQPNGPSNLPVPQPQYFGTVPITGRVNGVAYDPRNNGTIYLASAAGGVWKSVNWGVNWNSTSQFWPDLHTSCIAIDPNHPDTVYVGTGDYPGDQRGALANGYGIERSTDGGQTWQLLSDNKLTNRKISSIWVDPDDSNHLLATSGRDGNTLTNTILYSSDGGNSWQYCVCPSGNFGKVVASAPRPAAVRRYYYASGDNSATAPANLTRSTDGGVTFYPLPNFPPSRGGTANNESFVVETSKLYSDTIYVIAEITQKVWKSPDAGNTWVDITNNFPNGGTNGTPATYDWSQPKYDEFLGTSTKNGQDVIYVGLIDVVKSVDGGLHWGSIGGPTYGIGTAKIHNDQHAFAVNPANPDDVLIGNDGGVYRYRESTNSFTNLNRTLCLTQFFSADWDNATGGTVLGGTQDNGSPWLVNGVWKSAGGGDGGSSLVDPTDNRTMVVTVNGKTYLTTDSWTTSNQIALGGALAFDPSDHTKIYTSTGGNLVLYRNVNPSSTTYFFGPNDSAGIRCIAVAPTDSQRIYCGGFGRFWMSNTGGRTWQDMSTAYGSRLPNALVVSISIDPADADSVIVTLAGAGIKHVYQGLSMSAPFAHWTDISGGYSLNPALPDISVNCVSRDPREPSRTFYIGTDVGVFVTTNGGLDWYNATQPLGLPNAPVMSIKAVLATSTLNVATFGRGIWKMPLSTETPTVVSVLPAPATLYEGQSSTVTFSLGSKMPYPGQNVNIYPDPPLQTTTYVLFMVPGTNKMTFRVNAGATDTVVKPKVTVSMNNSLSTSVTVNPAIIGKFDLGGANYFGGSVIHAKLILTGIPQAARYATLTSSSKNLTFPAKVLVSAGSTSVPFDITSVGIDKDETITLKVDYHGSSLTGSLKLRAGTLASLDTDQKSYGIDKVGYLTVNLTAPAGPSGTKVVFSVAPTGKISLFPSVVIAPGQTSQTVSFLTSYVATQTNVTVTASGPLGPKVSTTLQISP